MVSGSHIRCVLVVLSLLPKLMAVLNDESHTNIITWLPNGRGFRILRRKSFEKKVLVKYFSKSSQFSSFTRKLNRWYGKRDGGNSISV
jgi:HSF-type DNA-binding